MKRDGRIDLLVFVALALVGCAPSDDGVPARDTRSIADTLSSAPPAPATGVSPSSLATRHEAQAHFDRARAALVREDFAASARALMPAIAFIRRHADEAELGAVAALQGAAKELEVLAQRLAQGEAQTTRSFDRIVANANRAEAQHHLTRAKAAIATRDYVRGGEELVMSVDHMERAAWDLERRRPAAGSADLSRARALGVAMVQGRVPTRAETRRATDQLEAELRRLCAIIDEEARACALEAAR
ncbi:MAG TPA: hypothetical protein VFZ21_13260 [Gemmatimonadaceae bacterium]|nr:hypothetical protein [Gemmatimonadaceae bacterium]